MFRTFRQNHLHLFTPICRAVPYRNNQVRPKNNSHPTDQLLYFTNSTLNSIACSTKPDTAYSYIYSSILILVVPAPATAYVNASSFIFAATISLATITTTKSREAKTLKQRIPCLYRLPPPAAVAILK